ncbi:MAG: PadR family transcriptional regulator [Streptococcaceae bacterium]|jgi:DNA-binding PadR family transcriptional regulator|nr:PadR family transcriptional regulator [Streptococcaceae bacterium]
MDNFLLGLLMSAKLTAYELHVMIRDNYDGISSNSLGNIQRALKILHKDGFVSMEEIPNGKTVKKVFTITISGRLKFLDWTRQPIALTKVKNIEIGKLLLLGYLSKEEQIKNIESVIASLKEEFAYLTTIQEAISNQRETLKEQEVQVEDALKEMISSDLPFFEEILQATKREKLDEVFADVEKFSLLTLKLAFDETQFYLEWFENLLSKLYLEKAN